VPGSSASKYSAYMARSFIEGDTKRSQLPMDLRDMDTPQRLRLICRFSTDSLDCTRDKTEKMVGTWRKRGLIVNSGQRSNQRKEVSTLDIAPCQSHSLSAGRGRAQRVLAFMFLVATGLPFSAKRDSSQEI